MKINLNFEVKMNGVKDEETLANLVKTLQKVEETRPLSDVTVNVVVNTNL